MSSPFSGLISSAFKQVWKDAITEVVRGCSVPCRLIYQSAPQICPNCIYSPLTNSSSNLYNGTGPYPFPNGSICPFCNGVGRIENEPTENISTCVIREPNKWVHIGDGNVVRDKDYAQTLSVIELVPQLRRAKEIILNTDIEGYANIRWERDGEVSTLGLGEDAFVLVWWRLKQ